MNSSSLKKGNALIVIIIVLAIIIGGVVVIKMVLPRILSGVLNKTVTTAVNSSIDNLDFTNADVADINQDLSKNEGMHLQIGLNKGRLTIDGNSSGDAVIGQIKYLGKKPLIDFQTQQDKLAYFLIKSADEAGEQTNLHLSQTTNARLDIGLGAGSVDVDLTDLDIPYLNIGAGAGSVKVTFSHKKSTQANLAAGAGKLDIYVPSKVERRLSIAQGAGFSNFQVGNDYIKVGDGYQTREYDKANVKLDIVIGQTAGGFNITPF
jgi:hypothetical protein